MLKQNLISRSIGLVILCTLNLSFTAIVHAQPGQPPDIIESISPTTAEPGEINLTTDYTLVDTGQDKCYDNTREISPPDPGEGFYGQDAQYQGNQPVYQDNGDGAITDLNTGLMWQKTPGDKVTFDEALAGAGTFSLAGYDDWRLPTIKELYSLILFSGTDPSGPQADTDGLTPFIDTEYFDFEYGDENAGERIIDAQYWSSTEYVSTTMGGSATTFGVNFADGRIKGYGRERPGGGQMVQFVRYMRGNPDYGKNNFFDKGDGTITDLATGMMWQKADDGNAYNWQDAMEYTGDLELAGHSDWRLPNAKELQSIVDYTRSPSTTQSAAIDPLFMTTSIINEAGEQDYPFYWTGTTHVNGIMGNGGGNAAYVAFGRALGYMGGQWIDVHGAGAQRSDPKAGDPDDYPYGRGPQGDNIRIFNFVRCVRDADITGVENPVGVNTDSPLGPQPSKFGLIRNFPNPFNPVTTISFILTQPEHTLIKIYNLRGELIEELLNGMKPTGGYFIIWNASSLPSGPYLIHFQAGDISQMQKCMLTK